MRKGGKLLPQGDVVKTPSYLFVYIVMLTNFATVLIRFNAHKTWQSG